VGQLSIGMSDTGEVKPPANKTGGFSESVLFKRNLLRKSACFVYVWTLTRLPETRRMPDALV
jgi:hypothetical protein